MSRRVNSYISRAYPDDPNEQNILEKAVRRAVARPAGLNFLDYSPASTVVRNLGIQSVGEVYRKAERIAGREIRLASRQIAFGALPDPVREEYAMFCHLMYLGFQKRFLNRHPDEEPEEFLERPRKTTVNLTRLVVRLKSQLYSNPPIREIDEKWAARNPRVADKLGELWSDLWNLTMIHIDRMTRLMGTVSVRPMIDETSDGGIRLWVFLPSQLRVIPKRNKPWLPEAVIERHDPENPRGRIIVWTDKTQLEIEKGAITKVKKHGMGRIPHTFFKNELSFQSFFVEGIGRGLCDENANINDKLSDLNEIVQMQGFGYAQVFNPTEDKVAVGPRRAAIFETSREQAENNIKQGIEFASPGAPIDDVRADVEADIKNLLRVHRIPEVAVGVDLGSRAMSGIAMKMAFAPLYEDLDEREKLFRPYEIDLADNALRVLHEYVEGFTYEPRISGRPEFSIAFEEPSAPVSIREQLLQDEFDITHGITTPAQIIKRRDPAKYSDPGEAQERWHKNLEEIREGAVGGISDFADDATAGSGGPSSLMGRLLEQYGEGEYLDDLVDVFDGSDRRNGTGT